MTLGIRRSLLLLACAVLCTAAGPGKPAGETCGWLIESGDGLVEQADHALDPLDPGPLTTPPAGAKAAYCLRDAMMTQKGDERLLKLRLPLVIRSGDREGVIELSPSVLYVPGRIKSIYEVWRIIE